MKKTFKLALVMALVVVMALSLVACGGAPEAVSKVEQVEFNETGLPIFDTMQTITLVTEDGNSTLENIQDAYNFKYYKTKANMDIKVTNGRPMATKIALLMATNTLPDFIWRTRLNYANFIKYQYEGNYFLDFNPYIDAGKMPGFELFCSMIPGDYRKICTSANDGTLASFAKSNLQSPGGGTIAQEYWSVWNMAWLEEANASVPYTREELWTTLAALKNAYGASSESQVIVSQEKTMTQGIMLYLARGYGFTNYKVNVVVGDDGKFEPFYDNEDALNNYRNLMKDYNKLYTEGYLDPWFETRTSEEVKSLGLQNKVAFGSSTNFAQVNEPGLFEKYKAAGGTYTFAVAHILPAEAKKANIYYLDSNPTSTGEMWGCINNASKYADALVRFFDWHFEEHAINGQKGKGDVTFNDYDRELMLMINGYVEGYTCTYDAATGAYDFSDYMDESFGGDTYLFIRSQFIPELMLFAHGYAGEWADWQENDKYTVERLMNYNLYETEDEQWNYGNVCRGGIAKNMKEKKIPSKCDPTLARNSAQTSANKNIAADMNNFLAVWVIQFVKGDKNPADDADWNAFLADLKKVDLSGMASMNDDIYANNGVAVTPYSQLWG